MTAAGLRARCSAYATVALNAAAILATRFSAALLGYLFWWLAARAFSQPEIGFTGALLSSLELVYRVAALGVGTLLVAEIHRTPHRRPALLRAGLLLTGAAGLLLGALCATIAPGLLFVLSPLHAFGGAGVALFAAGSALATMALTVDDVLIGLLRPGWQIVRGIAAALTRLAIVAAAVASGLPMLRHPLTLLAAWVAADAASLLLVYALARGRVAPARTPQMDGEAGGAPVPMRALLRPALPHHALNIVLMASGLLLPLAAGAVLSATDYALFYLAWINDALAFTIPYAFVSVLYAVGNAEPSQLRVKLRQVLVFGALAAAFTTVAFWIAAEPVLRTFGRQGEYAGAAMVLRLSVAALIPVLVKGIFVTLRRMAGRMRETTWLMLGVAVVEIAAPVLGGVLFGLFGFAAGWLCSQIVIGLAVLPSVLRVMRADSQTFKSLAHAANADSRPR